ncbi:hypothetical protein [Mucilaginibacter sp. dw_454]|uniref:hypothetical protein n=1 Tax=Mucilaginibacter sp. dw_454 TaxID=2720079 RepID=UPI001BD1C719|nr:hypothetical protein [Mucilaginibacter sp. dw_454]
MSDKTLKISSGLLSLALLVTLIFKLQNVPGGMILSGLFLGLMIIVGILLACIPVASLLKFVFKKNSFLTLYSISTVVAFLYFHYTLYSPTLKLIVPIGYKGQVNLVLSNVTDNILVLDTNGIGYINEWTFNHTYSIPQVYYSNGININNLCVGFNPSTFWGGGKTCCMSGREIQSLSFEIVSKDKIGQKSYDNKDLTLLVNKKLATLLKPDQYTKIQTDSAKVQTK